MLKRKQRVLINQLDNKLANFENARQIPAPANGWINAVRTALSMSLRQLANRLKMTPQAVKGMEDREREGAITINGLKDVAEALDMTLVYALVPKDGSLEEMINKRALEMAEQIVRRTSGNMRLEDQENSEARLKKAIVERAEELKFENLKLLWE